MKLLGTKFDRSKFETEKEYLDFVVRNEGEMFETAKGIIKEADGFGSFAMPLKDGLAEKSIDVDQIKERGYLLAKLAINTTNVIDSHDDVHIPGLWDKSLKENKRILHLQEHKRTFRDIITSGDDLKAYVEDATWKQLGFNMSGKTQVLTFDAKVREDKNSFMFKQYVEGSVTEHSVGMQYVKMLTCINDDDYPTQKENWDKYAPMVHNGLDGRKIFWAILEAKCVEGSAVPLGSNSFTPTRSIKTEPVEQENDILEAIKEWQPPKA